MTVVNAALIDSGHRVGHGQRLSDVLFDLNGGEFGSLVKLPCNEDAIETAGHFAAGVVDFAALVGPSGWGKSCILAEVGGQIERRRRQVEFQSAVQFLEGPHRYESGEVLVLDDAQEAMARTRTRSALRTLLERRVRTNRPTLLAFTMPKPNRQVKSLLPSYRDWFVSVIDVPEPNERLGLVQAMSRQAGLDLDTELINIMALRMKGDGRTLVGALNHLKLMGPTWHGHRCALRACGLMNAYFTSNPHWDLGLKILRTASRFPMPRGSLTMVDLSVFAMLEVAGMQEAEVARSVEISATEVYRRHQAFLAGMAADPDLARALDAVVREAVRDLAEPPSQ
jgi:hypothetical protein